MSKKKIDMICTSFQTLVQKRSLIYIHMYATIHSIVSANFVLMVND